jgi:hypothetical protein
VLDITCNLTNTRQAADRRDRLIYVLSQINAARGDDGMAVDEASDEDESEDEVHFNPCSWSFTNSKRTAGRGILLPRLDGTVRGTPQNSRVLPAQVGHLHDMNSRQGA